MEKSVMKQHLIYDSDGTNSSERRVFFVDTGKAVIRAAGLEEEVGVYIAVGECYTCGPDDVMWEPLVLCGTPVTVSPDNTQIVLSGNGKYSVGDPNDADFSLSGDVNISVEHVDDDYEATGCPDPVGPKPGSAPDSPVYVQEIAPSVLLLEGCVAGSDGPEEAVVGVNSSDGSLAWGPIPKSDYGFVDCCPEDV